MSQELERVADPILADDTPPLIQKLWGIAGYVGRLPRGPRAELRRLTADGAFIPPQAFWNLVDRYAISQRDEDFWLHIVPLMVEHPHDSSTAPGVALARAGVSASRIERFLRLDRDGAWAEAGRLLSHLGEAGLDWAGTLSTWRVGFGPLLHGWMPEQRRHFARQFFLSPEYRKRKATGDDA
jgi:hypothetical protein